MLEIVFSRAMAFCTMTASSTSPSRPMRYHFLMNSAQSMPESHYLAMGEFPKLARLTVVSHQFLNVEFVATQQNHDVKPLQQFPHESIPQVLRNRESVVTVLPSPLNSWQNAKKLSWMAVARVTIDPSSNEPGSRS